ncbi:hypothetical protein DM02DRAFT_651580 [Periconia macrospinosa]|uniref:Uncharacterized protein n=1 Tax=Periconia macrospinosa TaxID=97972 RepID=A0A2V1E1W4_9PLEO|nr:hypothetical protein DM02DRAFT_651580 [Periconia macrospinosa]
MRSIATESVAVCPKVAPSQLLHIEPSLCISPHISDHVTVLTLVGCECVLVITDRLGLLFVAVMHVIIAKPTVVVVAKVMVVVMLVDVVAVVKVVGLPCDGYRLPTHKFLYMIRLLQ